MAGSYNHAVYSDGSLKDNEDFVASIENLGDAYEMAEEMYGMIWYLAGHAVISKYGASVDWKTKIGEMVEEARQRYAKGISMYAPGEQKAQF